MSVGHRKLLSQLLSELCMESQDYLNGGFVLTLVGYFKLMGMPVQSPIGNQCGIPTSYLMVQVSSPLNHQTHWQ